MTAELQSIEANPGVFPLALPADALGTSDGMSTNHPGWQDFEWTRADGTTISWIVQSVGRREKRHSTKTSAATGPSEATVLPTTLDVTEDKGDDMPDLAIAAGVGEEALFAQAASEAGLDIEREVIAHLPPKRTFGSLLRVLHRGRARPNITLEWTPDKVEET